MNPSFDDTSSMFLLLMDSPCLTAIIEDGSSQLFYASMRVGDNLLQEYDMAGFYQLTRNGNNYNPVAKIGSDNNLHVVWESDRSGVKQIYYGVVDLSIDENITIDLLLDRITGFTRCSKNY